MRNIYDLTLQELEEYFIQIGEKPFRATQVYEGLYKKRLNSFDEMTNISKELREKLEKIISHGLPNGMNSKVVSDYYLNNILKLDDKELQKTLMQSKALQVYSKYNIFKNSKAEIENALNMINTSSRNNFYKCNGDLTKLATILSGVSAELYMNSVNLKDKNPRQVEEILQKGYYLYNETKLNDRSYEVDENGVPNIEGAVDYLNEANQIVYDAVDYAFGNKISDVLFQHCSPYAIVNGEYFIWTFFNAMAPVLEDIINKSQKKANENMNKYLSKYMKKR